MNGIQFVLRWVVAIPAGLGAAILVMFPVHWGILLLYFFVGSDPDAFVTVVGDDGEVRGCGLMGLTCYVSPDTLERLAQTFVAPFVTLTVVGRVVPSQRFYAVGVLFVIYLIFFGAVMGMSAFASGEPLYGRIGFAGYSGWGWLEFVAALVLGVSGAVASLTGPFQDWRRTRTQRM